MRQDYLGFFLSRSTAALNLSGFTRDSTSYQREQLLTFQRFIIQNFSQQEFICSGGEGMPKCKEKSTFLDKGFIKAINDVSFSSISYCCR